MKKIKVTASTDDVRVVQISLDIEIPAGEDGDKVASFVDATLNEDTEFLNNGFYCLDASFAEDMTDVYNDDYR